MAAPPHLELGATDDSKQLVPGDVATVQQNAQALADEQRALSGVKGDLLAISAEGAIDAGIASIFYGLDRGELFTMIESYDKALGAAHDALTTYAGELRSAQEGAQRALDTWNEGERATAQAVLDHNAAVAAYNSFVTRPCQPSLSGIGGQPVIPSMGPGRPGEFVDPGEGLREQAQQILIDARDGLLEAAGQALHALGVKAKGTGGADGDSAFEGPSIDWNAWEKDFGNSMDGVLDDKQGKGDDDEKSPFSLSLGSVEGGVAVYDKEGNFENYFGDVKVSGDGSVTVLGVDGKAEATIDKDGVTIGAEGTATLVGTEGKVNVSLGPAEVGAEGAASIEASASGDLTATWKEGVHAGGEVFVGGRAEVEVSADVGGVGGEAGVEGWAGFGAGADADVGWKDGKLEIKGEGGIAVLLGGKLKGGISLDLPEIYNSGKDLIGLLG